MKKIEKMIHQIIRFRGNIEAFLVSIEEFSRSNIYEEGPYPTRTFSLLKAPTRGALRAL